MGILSAMINSLSTFYPKSQSTRTVSMQGRGCARSSALSPKCPHWRPSATKTTWATPTCTRTTSLGYVENFLHMMYGLPTEEYTADPVVSGCTEQAADPARRPRAELQRQHGAHGGQQRSANLYSSVIRRYRGLVGSAARRCQPRGDRNAGDDPQRRRRHPKVGEQGQGQATTPSACSASGTGFIRTSIRAPRSSRKACDALLARSWA
jgi:hypothetical protein